MGKLYSDLKLAHVSGRGHGKKAAQQAYIQSQSGELVPIGVVDTGFSLGPVDADSGKLVSTNYEAEMTFEPVEFNEKAVERLFATPHDSHKWIEEARGLKLAAWQKSMYRNIMGSWKYTPADELRNRLNARLKGWPPAPAVNTRYWRGL